VVVILVVALTVVAGIYVTFVPETNAWHAPTRTVETLDSKAESGEPVSGEADVARTVADGERLTE
jgi:hypothetical protein